jgi:hypothetical protein
MATTNAEMGRPAERPANSVLASGRETPIRLPPWRRGLSDYLARRSRPESEEPQPRRRRTSRRQPALERWVRPKDEPTDDEEGAPPEEEDGERDHGRGSAGEDAA